MKLRLPIALASGALALSMPACNDDGNEAATTAGLSASGSTGSGGASSASTSTSSGSTSDASTTGSTGGTDSTGTATTDASSTSAGSSSTGPKFDAGDNTATAGMTTGVTTGDSGTATMGCKKVDLLFVIDDSGSMSEEQDQLTSAFPQFAATMNQQLVVNQGIDYRVGVVSVDMSDPSMCTTLPIVNITTCGQGHRGRLQHAPDPDRNLGCNDVPAGRWIEGSTGQPDVGKQFRCIASMGGGNFEEMPLEAARAALVDRVNDQEGYNLGFLRPDALLVLVIMTDEDDQSVYQVPQYWDPPMLSFPPTGGAGPASPVSQYWDTFVELKGGHPENITVIAISGAKNDDFFRSDPQNPLSVKAPRVHELLDLASPNSFWSQISLNDYDSKLQEALSLIEGSCSTFIPPG